VSFCLAINLSLTSPQYELDPPLLLDTYSGAAAAYSLRKLRLGQQYAVRVRRSSDNAEQDIGFAKEDLDIASLMNFVGSGSGYVTTWYDQSGNNRHQTQATAGNQLAIVTAGVYEGGLTMPGSISYTANFSQPCWMFMVATWTDSAQSTLLNDNVLGGYIYRSIATNEVTGYFGAYLSTARPLGMGAGRQIVTYHANGANSYVKHQNTGWSTSRNGNSGTNSFRPSLVTGNGKRYEIVYFPTVTDQDGIEANINKYWGVYDTPYEDSWNGTQSSLLDTYSNAAAAYSLRALNSQYKGPLIRVRRSSDNSEQNIFALASGDLDIARLLTFVGAGSGYVTTWYDQSGNGRNATQATSTKQFRIVDTGVLETYDGKPCLSYVSTAELYYAVNQAQPVWMVGVVEVDSASTAGTNRPVLSGLTGLMVYLGSGGASGVTLYSGANYLGTGAQSCTNQRLIITAIGNATSSYIGLRRANGNKFENTGNAGTGAVRAYGLASGSSSWPANRRMEAIFWTSEVDLIGVELNINSYWNVYTPVVLNALNFTASANSQYTSLGGLP